jgi:hypothetical protein
MVLALVAGALAAPPGAADASVAAKARPKPVPRCLALADPRGDALVRDLAPTNDAALDLTAVRFPASRDRSFVVTLTVAQWGDRAATGVGSRFQVAFAVGDKVVDVYYKTGPARLVEAELFYQQGVRVGGVFFSPDVIATRTGNTLTLSVKLSVLSDAVDRPVAGVTARQVEATTWSSYVATNDIRDTVTTLAPLVLGAACR